MAIVEEVEKFVYEYYNDKDQMHDLSHIKRVLRSANLLNQNYGYPQNKLVYGAYFHGIIHDYEDKIRDFLERQGKDEIYIAEIITLAKESSKNSIPKTLGGSILHDAHLIEGGRTFIITKSLVTGTIRQQSVFETISYIDNHILGKFQCVLPESKQKYHEMEQFAIEFIKDLKENL